MTEVLRDFKKYLVIPHNLTTILLMSMLSVILNLYVALKILALTGSPAKQSFAVFVYNILYFLTSLIWKTMTLDKELLKKSFSFALIGLCISSIVLSIVSSFKTILLLFSLFSIMLAVFVPLSIGVLSNRLKRESEISLKWNYFNSLGSMFGFLLAGLLVYKIDLHFLIFSLVFLLIFSGYKIGKEIDVDAPKVLTSPLPQHNMYHIIVETFDKFMDIKKDVFYLKMFIRKLNINLKRRYSLTQIGILLFFIGVGLFFTPLPSLLTLIGLGRRDIYLLYAAFHLFSIIGFKALVKFPLRYENMYDLLWINTAIRAFVFLLPAIMFFGHISPTIALVSFVIASVGFTWAFIGTTMLGILLYIPPPYERARAASAFNTIYSLGTVLGSLITTVVVARLGLGVTYILGSLFMLLSLFLFIKAKSAFLS